MSTGTHVLFGTGPAGRAVAGALLDQGVRVRMVNGSGNATIAGVDTIGGDATDPAFAREVAADADTVYFCLNAPHYHRWASEFPPLQHAVLAAARRCQRQPPGSSPKRPACPPHHRRLACRSDRLAPQRAVIVDEASMVPTLVLDEIVRVAGVYGSKLTLIADFAQMGAPEAGRLLRDLAGLPSAVELTVVRRFQHKWGADASLQLRGRDPAVAATHWREGRINETSTDRVFDDAAGAW